MRIYDLIAKKRDGGTHSREELESIVNGYVSGEVADYQMAAWMMAVYLRGMTDEETAELTDVMAHSGVMVDLSPIPGIKVVAPSNPYDAKMVLKAAIECDDPVLYFENKILYKEKGEVPEIGEEEPYTLGKARVEREGKDVTIVSYSIGMKNARGAADLLAKEGIEAEVIDLITLSPWDKETVLNSVKKTHRLCIVHEAVKQGGFGAEISATVAEEAMEYLDAPILRYGAPFCPIPFAPTLEKMVKVVPEDLVKGIKGMF